MKDILNIKKHKQKHLSNIQPDISKSKKISKLIFNQIFSQAKKQPSNIRPNIFIGKEAT